MTGAAERRQNQAERGGQTPGCWNLDFCLVCLLVTVQSPTPQINGLLLSLCSVIAGSTTQNTTDALYIYIRPNCHTMSLSRANWTPCILGVQFICFPKSSNNSTGEMLLLCSIYGCRHGIQRTEITDPR